MKFQFELGSPFKPFEQLMGVLPVASKEHIPVAYHVRPLSLSIDSQFILILSNILCLTYLGPNDIPHLPSNPLLPLRL
jgi:hypothetical protein